MSILIFTKTKIKIKDILFVLGFFLFSLIAIRNMYFYVLIGLIYFTNIITCFLNTYIKEEDLVFTKLENSKVVLISICSFILIVSFCQISEQINKEYVDDLEFPIEAVNWMKKNIKIDDNMRIWNHFDWGSYLELNGIKVFLDSRSGMYTEQENKGVTVLRDWLDVVNGDVDYEDVFKKYDINYVLVKNDELINIYIKKDDNYKLIYQDILYSLYKKK